MSEKTLHVSFLKIPSVLPTYYFEKFKSLLTIELRNIVTEYHFYIDQQLNLFGKILLANGMLSLGIDFDFKKLTYNKYGRPCLSDSFDFNISHSGNYVCCVITDTGQVGIDIELIKPLIFDDYTNFMNHEQWRQIERSENPLSQFFQFWVIKESVIKADSRGLSIPLNDIHIKDGQAICQSKTWYTQLLRINNKYHACIASSFPITTYNIREVDVHWLYNFYFANKLMTSKSKHES